MDGRRPRTRNEMIDFIIARELRHIPSIARMDRLQERDQRLICDEFGAERNERHDALSGEPAEVLDSRYLAARDEMQSEVEARLAPASDLRLVALNTEQAVLAWKGCDVAGADGLIEWAYVHQHLEPWAADLINRHTQVETAFQAGLLGKPITPARLASWAALHFDDQLPDTLSAHLPADHHTPGGGAPTQELAKLRRKLKDAEKTIEAQGGIIRGQKDALMALRMLDLDKLRPLLAALVLSRFANKILGQSHAYEVRTRELYPALKPFGLQGFSRSTLHNHLRKGVALLDPPRTIGF